MFEADYYGSYGMRDLKGGILSVENDPHMTFKVTTAPTVEPITVPILKLYARIDSNYEDTILSNIIIAIREMTEKYLNRALIEQSITMKMDYWYNISMEMPRAPLISITSVSTLDESDVETLYSSSNYYTDTISEPGKLIIKNSVTPPYNTTRFQGGYKIVYKAGYGSTASYVPTQIKEGMKMWAAAVYDNRVPSDEPPPMAKILLDPYRIVYL